MRRARRAGRAAVLGAGLAAVWLGCGPSLAQEPPPTEEGRSAWSAEKCRRYAIAWSELLARRGRRDLGAEFLERHERFLASGCLAQRDVCPRTPGEFEVANMLTVAAMNAGAASTFLPFACR